jgi:hypothetical protein
MTLYPEQPSVTFTNEATRGVKSLIRLTSSFYAPRSERVMTPGARKVREDGCLGWSVGAV